MTNKIDVKWHFAIPVYTVQLNGFDERKQALTELIHSVKAQQHGDDMNAGLWQSDTTLHLIDDPNVKWLNSQIGEVVKACVLNFNKSIKNFDIVMTGHWATTLDQGVALAPHNHFPSHWSGIFNVNAESCCNIEQNEKAGALEILNPMVPAGAFGLPSSVMYPPQDGTLIIYHSSLQHWVNPHFTDNSRITTSFNCNVVPKH